MIDSEAITNFINAFTRASHNYRTWVGRASKSDQESYLGHYFGNVVLLICEKEKSISELKRSKHGPIKYQGEYYEVRAVFFVKKPMLSRYDCASKTARNTITQLMHQYRSASPLSQYH